MPAVVIFTLAFVPKPFDHKYVPPPAAVLLTLVVLHVKFVLPIIDAAGNVLSIVTAVVAVAVHPLAFVTVTV